MDGSIDTSLASKQVIHSDKNNRYKIIEPLGSGGNSSVYLCQAQAGLHRGLLFAIKLMVNVHKQDRVARFKQEHAFLEKINHPAALRTFDSGAIAFGPSENRLEVPFYVSEYLPKTLRDAMSAGLLMVDKVAIAVQLLSLLCHLDELGIIHRDIKPENIFIRGRGAVLGDFGLLKATAAGDGCEEFSIGELSRGIRHPYQYPTPELILYARGEGEITSKSDIYQLGLVFAEMFCGENPIKPRARNIDSIELNKPRAFAASNSGVIVSLIDFMLKEQPKERPSAPELLDRWTGILAEVVTDAQRLEGKAFW